MAQVDKQLLNVADIEAAYAVLKDVVLHTPLTENITASEKYGSHVYFKREDLQIVRSYKLRGAYYKMSTLSSEELSRGVVCASAGNHAQGVAYSCQKLKCKGTIFMPAPTPRQKVDQVRMFGKEYVDIVLSGDTYDDAYAKAMEFCNLQQSAFIHPFDDTKVMAGQGTVGLEILEDAQFEIDYLFLPVGGGGLGSGVSTYFKALNPKTKIIAVEPEGAAALFRSLELGENTTLDKIDKFVDGAAVKRMGEQTFKICQENIDQVVTVHEGKVCATILELYNKDAIVVEPAGALSLAALAQFADEIKGKNVVCVLSGSNNDISRTEEIRERSLLYEGLKHYFIINFPQRAGALMTFLSEVLGPDDDIVHFEYSKRTSREQGPAVVGIELKRKEDLAPLLQRMKDTKFLGEYLNDKPLLYQYLV